MELTLTIFHVGNIRGGGWGQPRLGVGRGSVLGAMPVLRRQLALHVLHHLLDAELRVVDVHPGGVRPRQPPANESPRFESGQKNAGHNDCEPHWYQTTPAVRHPGHKIIKLQPTQAINREPCI